LEEGKNMRFVSIPKLAEIFDLSAPTVRARVKSGEWPSYSLGERSVRLDVEEIKALLHTPGKKKGVMELLADEAGNVVGLRGSAKRSKE
jgi:predicted DNA-binding transcriptional regulator AlpA